MTDDDDRATTHLRRLGVNPVVTARLRGYAEQDGLTLRELAVYILSDYAPAQVIAEPQPLPPDYWETAE